MIFLVMLADFMLKKWKIRKGNLFLTKNWLERNQISFAEDNKSYMSNICAKEFSRFELQLSSYWQTIDIQEIDPNFTYLQKS